jgi:hypothetical protein
MTSAGRYVAWSWPLLDILGVTRDEARSLAAAEKSRFPDGRLLNDTFVVTQDTSNQLHAHQIADYDHAGEFALRQ